MKISIFRLGYVGAVSVACLARADVEASEGEGIAPFCSEFRLATVHAPLQGARMIATLPTPITASASYFDSSALGGTIRRLVAASCRGLW